MSTHADQNREDGAEHARPGSRAAPGRPGARSGGGRTGRRARDRDGAAPVTGVYARCLDAAGILDPETRSAFVGCRELNARIGPNSYRASLLLPPAKRPFTHSLYAFAAYADELVDNGDPATKEREMKAWTERVRADLEAGDTADPLCHALLYTLRTWDIPVAYIETFLDAMLLDLTVTEFATYEDLRSYMYGAAVVPGLEAAPILGTLDENVSTHIRRFGEAFQISNIVRDIAEDLDRGRVYVPLEDLDRFRVSKADLARRVVTPEIRALLEFEVDRARALYIRKEEGVRMFAPSSRACVRTGVTLFEGILDGIERIDYQVFAHRATIGRPRRARVVAGGYLRSRPAVLRDLLGRPPVRDRSEGAAASPSPGRPRSTRPRGR